MISFRYHIVSLIAVFFAMAIGVLVGTTVINQGLINSLQSQRNHNRAELSAERELNANLNAEGDVWERVAKSTFDPATQGRLRDRELVLVTAVSDVPAPADAVADRVEDAGAVVAGRIELGPRWKLLDPDDRATLATALGSRETERDELLDVAARALASRLRNPAAIEGDDLLRTLDAAGFLELSDLTVERFPPRGSAVVYIQPPGEGVAPDPNAFALPLMMGLASGGPVAAVEPLRAKTSITDIVTADPQARARILSVDHIDTTPGTYSLVIGLADLYAGEAPGHFGMRKRTSGVIPVRR